MDKRLRPENKRMREFLLSHGIDAMPMWIKDGSLKNTWRLYNRGIKWSLELAQKLNSLGFSASRREPFGLFDGNGGVFSVFARGHENLAKESKLT